MFRSFLFTHASVLTLCGLIACGLFACGTWSPENLSDAAKERRVGEMAEEIRRDLPEVPEWTPAELHERRAEVVLVDVRPESERAVSRIAGAISAEEWERAPRRGVKVVAYCTIGRRSGEWVRRRRALGEEAYNLAGSLLAWTHAGYGLEDPAGRSTRRLHVYGPEWDLAPAGWTTVW